MFEQLVELLGEVYEGDMTEFNEDMELMDDLELTSLEFFTYITNVESELGIRINERERQRIVTLGDLLEVVEQKAS